jgi:hypothetical protein
VPSRLIGVTALALAACSSPDAPTSADASRDTTSDEGPGCLFCGGDAAIDAPLPDLVQGKIDQICANPDGCHGANAGGLVLSPGYEFKPLIDVPAYERPELFRVKPGDPLQSYVYLKLWCDGGIDGGCMPLSSGANPDLAKLFHDWIEAGAPLPQP